MWRRLEYGGLFIEIHLGDNIAPEHGAVENVTIFLIQHSLSWANLMDIISERHHVPGKSWFVSRYRFRWLAGQWQVSWTGQGERPPKATNFDCKHGFYFFFIYILLLINRFFKSFFPPYFLFFLLFILFSTRVWVDAN